MRNKKYLTLYLSVTFGLWWLIAAVFLVFSPVLHWVVGHKIFFGILTIFILYLPSIMGFVTYYAYGKSHAMKQLLSKLVPRKKDLFWFPVLFVVMVFFAFCMHYGSVVFGIGVPKITYSVSKMISITLLNLVEEVGLLGGIFGWIGFLLPFLQSQFKNNIVAGLLTGFLFGLWVLPGYLIPAFGATTSYPLYVLQLMAFVLFQSYIFNATEGNLLFYLFDFWLAATGSHIQLYYFNAPVQVLEILFFLGASIVIHFILKRSRIGVLQTFPQFLVKNAGKFHNNA